MSTACSAYIEQFLFTIKKFLYVYLSPCRRSFLTRRTAHTCVPTNWSLSNSSGGACKTKWRTSFRRFVYSLDCAAYQFVTLWSIWLPGSWRSSSASREGSVCVISFLDSVWVVYMCLLRTVSYPEHAYSSLQCFTSGWLEVIVEKYYSL